MGMMSKWKSRMARARDRPGQGSEGGGASLRLRMRPRVTSTDVSLVSSETIYAAVNRIASALATMPIKLYRGFEPVTTDARYAMLRLRPNQSISAFSFVRAMEGCRNTEGRAYALILPDWDGVTPAGLQLLDPTRVTPLIEENTGALWYRITRPISGKQDYVPERLILSMQHLSTNGVEGLRPLDVLRGAAQYDAQIRRFSLDQLSGVTTGIILDFPVEMDSERRKAAVSEFLDVYAASEGNVMALDAGVKATSLTRSPIDPKVFDVERITRSRVALVYGLPPHLLGDYSDAPAGSIEQQTLEFLSLTMLPIVEMWEQELDYKLLTEQERLEGYAFRFDVNAILRADMATMAERNFKAVRSGYLTVNEVRAGEFQPPIEGGDDALVSKDLARLKDVVAGKTL